MSASTIKGAPYLRFGRRAFVTHANAFVASLLLAGPGCGRVATAPLTQHKRGDATPSLFIEIGPDSRVTLTCHRSEMGQQTWTAMAQLVANELEADWKRVTIVQAEGHPRYGDQNTDGSRSVRYNFDRLRTAGAAMRTLLERAAAQRWGVATDTCHAELGEVIHRPSRRRLSFGAVAAAASQLPLPTLGEIKLRDRPTWRYLAKSMPSLTTPQIVRGQGTFGTDVSLPGMLHAVIARPPQVLGYALTVEEASALQVPGVLKTYQLPRLAAPVHFKPLGGVAVIARDTWAALKGRKALAVTWAPGPNSGYDSLAFESVLRDQARRPGQVQRNRGDAVSALNASERKVVAEYYVPHLAHSPMEPPAVTAQWNGDHVQCWGSVQAPQAARRSVAEACGVDVEQVTIHVTWLGGGFGRKSKPDYFAEAALIARDARAPVKLTWTREDDLRHGYYHTVSAQRLEAALGEDGRCIALLHRTVFPPIGSTFNAGATRPSAGDLRQGATDTPFAVEHVRVEAGEAEAHIRIGWLRSVANIYHAFAVQSFAAELAHAAGRDPKDYLLELLGPARLFDPNQEGAEYDNYGSAIKDYPIDTARLAHVVRRVAALAHWGRPLPAGHGLGIAVHRSFVTYVATVVEVAVDHAGRLSIPGVWSVMDAGTVVNPNHAASQLEGGTLFGLSNALYGEITAKAGAIEQHNFPAWRVMRMNEAPRRMDVEIVDSSAPPGGVGEPPTPPAAPALANAIFAATGLRLRRLPIFGPDRRDRLPSQQPPQPQPTG